MVKGEQLGKRKTNQRDAIAQVIREAEGPLTVQQILDAARDRIDSLGIATVYRTVKLLLDANQIAVVTLPDGETRYEAADLGHHHHFHCRKCHRVFDLDMCPIAVPDGTTFPDGFRIEGHEVTLHGLCPDCSKAGPARDES